MALPCGVSTFFRAPSVRTCQRACPFASGSLTAALAIHTGRCTSSVLREAYFLSEEDRDAAMKSAPYEIFRDRERRPFFPVSLSRSSVPILFFFSSPSDVLIRRAERTSLDGSSIIANRDHFERLVKFIDTGRDDSLGFGIIPTPVARRHLRA